MGCPSLQVRSFSAENRLHTSVFRFRPGKAANSSPPSMSLLVTASSRWSVSPPSLSALMSPLMSPLIRLRFLVQKALKTVESEESVFRASGMPEPPNPQVFGRKRAPDVSFPLSARKSGEFQPAEHVTACHRFVTALFGAEKCASSCTGSTGS